MSTASGTATISPGFRSWSNVYMGAAIAASICCAVVPAAAQQIATPPGQLSSLDGDRNAFPAASFGSPLAFGMDGSTMGIAVFGQTFQPDASRSVDGSAAVSLGLGDADAAVGLETTFLISSISGRSGDGFGSAGGFGFKLHTTFPGRLAASAGVTGIGRYGNARNTNIKSVFANVSHVLPIGPSFFRRPAVVTIGVGDGAFARPRRSNTATDSVSGFVAGASGNAPTHARSIGAFVGTALYVTPTTSVICDYTGRFLNSAVSFVPLRKHSLVVTFGFINLTSEQNFDPEFAGAVSYSFAL